MLVIAEDQQGKWLGLRSIWVWNISWSTTPWHPIVKHPCGTIHRKTCKPECVKVLACIRMVRLYRSIKLVARDSVIGSVSLLTTQFDCRGGGGLDKAFRIEIWEVVGWLAWEVFEPLCNAWDIFANNFGWACLMSRKMSLPDPQMQQQKCKIVSELLSSQTCDSCPLPFPRQGVPAVKSAPHAKVKVLWSIRSEHVRSKQNTSLRMLIRQRLDIEKGDYTDVFSIPTDRMAEVGVWVRSGQDL